MTTDTTINGVSFQMLDRLDDLKRQKAEHEEWLKNISAEIERIQPVLVTQMLAAGLQNVKLADGRTFSLHSTMWAYARSAERGATDEEIGELDKEIWRTTAAETNIIEARAKVDRVKGILKAGGKDAVIMALKAEGMIDMVSETYNTSTLSAYVREIEDHDGELPPLLAATLDLTRKTEVRVTRGRGR